MSDDYVIVPVSRDEARAFIRRVHRHKPKPPAAEVLRSGLAYRGQLVAVALAGMPCKELMDGRTLEITRVAVDGVVESGCSRMYGSLRRAASALGWSRIYTYTRADEPGTSVRAAGFRRDADLPARNRVGWENRPGREAEEPTDRVRWVWP
jgi:hypothetical protein